MSIQPGTTELRNLERLLVMARQEDLGAAGDLTSSLLDDSATAVGRFVARQPMVVCGAALLETIAAAYDGGLVTAVSLAEGQQAQPGQELARWAGPARAMLTAERVALNFLQRLSAVATTTRAYVDAVSGSGAEVYDTRKTTPGWRDLEKYAVRVGGGKSHRRGLYDAVLVKDNHLAVLARATGGDPMAALAERLSRIGPTLPDHDFVEVEVDTLDQLAAALDLPVDIILLDNMTPDQLRLAVKMRNDSAAAGRIALEASGGITLASIGQVADTGVERISVGALTHSAGSVDIALEIEVD